MYKTGRAKNEAGARRQGWQNGRGTKLCSNKITWLRWICVVSNKDVMRRRTYWKWIRIDSEGNKDT